MQNFSNLSSAYQEIAWSVWQLCQEQPELRSHGIPVLQVKTRQKKLRRLGQWWVKN